MVDEVDIAEYLEPLTFQVSLPCSVVQAFDVFTAHIGDWWPLATHSVGQDRARSCRLEGRLGGRLIETSVDGSESTWAEGAVWEPPRRLEANERRWTEDRHSHG